MQKIENRRWMYSSESFQEYAMDKLLLIQPLKLEDEDVIHLLIDGITHLSIKSAAATLHADSVDHFLDEMHHIYTICDGALKKKQMFNSNFEKNKDNFKFKKSASNSKFLENAKDNEKAQKQYSSVCCRSKDHLREDLKLKKKEHLQKAVTVNTNGIREQ